MAQGDKLVIRPDAFARIFFTSLFAVFCGAGFYLESLPPPKNMDWIILRLEEVFIAGCALYCFSFAWWQKIECTGSTLIFRGPVRGWTLALGDIEFAKAGTVSSLKNEPAVRHWPKLEKRLAACNYARRGNPVMIVVKPRSMADDGYVLNAKAFNREGREALFDKLRANGVRAEG